MPTLPRFPLIFGLAFLCAAVLSERSAIAAPSACDGFEAADRIVCEKAEREDPEWRALRDKTCTPTKEALTYEWVDRFVEVCRRQFMDLLADSLVGRDIVRRLVATRDDFFRTVAVSRIIQLPKGSGSPLVKVNQRLAEWPQQAIKDWLDESGAKLPPDAELGNITIGYFGANALPDWNAVGLISLKYSQWWYFENQAHGNGRTYFEIFDRSRDKFVTDFSELFTDSKKAIDVVATILAKQLVRDNYEPHGKDDILPMVKEISHWRFMAEGFEIYFNSYELAGYIPPQREIIPYSAILPYIRKDGPLGRALGLK